MDTVAPSCVEIGALFVLKVIVLVSVLMGVIIFVLKKVVFDTTEGAKNRLDRETDEVRKKQSELNAKIKEANDELSKRRSEADDLVAKMKEEANTEAQGEREKIVKKARQDGEEIINKAQRTKDEIRKTLEKEIDMRAVDFTIILLKETLSELSLDLLDQNLIDEFFEGLQEVDMAMIDEDITTAEIASARPFSDTNKAKLAQILKKRLERDIAINVSEDKELIAGVSLRFGSLTLNASLRNVLQKKGLDIKERVEKGLLKIESV